MEVSFCLSPEAVMPRWACGMRLFNDPERCPSCGSSHSAGNTVAVVWIIWSCAKRVGFAK